eukprot:scaffold102766_cov20-Prasinocladus_malaysianus.AAC.2
MHLHCGIRSRDKSLMQHLLIIRLQVALARQSEQAVGEQGHDSFMPSRLRYVSESGCQCGRRLDRLWWIDWDR